METENDQLSSTPAQQEQPVTNDLFNFNEEKNEQQEPTQTEKIFATPEPLTASEPVEINEQSAKPATVLHSVNSIAGDSLGTLLTKARESASMSIEDVAKSTHIREDFLTFMEKDQTDKLPNPVFVRAYIRSLLSLYALDQTSCKIIEEHMTALEPIKEVPEKVLEEIGKDVQVSEEETKRLKSIFMYGGIILLLLISLTVTSIIAISIRNSKKAKIEKVEKNVPPFKTERLEQLRGPLPPKVHLLSVPENKI